MKDKIIEYINSLNTNQITDKYLEIIEELNLENIKQEVLFKLRDKGLYHTYIFNMLIQERYTELNFKENFNNILTVIENSIQKLSEHIHKIRKQIIIEECIEKYKQLFSGVYQVISNEELEVIKDINSLLQVVDFLKIDIDNYKMIVDKINEIYNSKEDLIKIINIFNKNEDNTINDINLATFFFEQFDWKKEFVGALTEEEKTNIYNILDPILKLKNSGESYILTKKIGVLFKELENNIYSCIINDIISWEQYINLINDINKVSSETIKILIQCNNLEFGLNNNITEQLFAEKQYDFYIIGKILWENNFTIEDKIDFKAYINIYNNHQEVSDIMSKNSYFLKLIIDDEEYLNINNVVRLKQLYLLILRQSIKFIKFIFENLSFEEIDEYLNSKWELDTEEDSYEFQNFICQENNIKHLENEEIYNSVKEKLWKSSHKSALTKARNKKMQI